MSLTIIGALVLAIGGLLMFFASTPAMLVFVLVTALFGGAAAIVLTALGNSTIPPANLALVLLALRCILPSPGSRERLSIAISANRALIIFALYGAIGAWILPRIFAGALDVTPLRPESAFIFAAAPLRFANQNVTVSFYLLGTLAGGVCGYVAGMRAGVDRLLVRAASTIAVVHALLGFLSIPFGRSAVFGFFRNGFYAQLDQSFDGFVRMNGIFAEPATYAAFGVIWLALTGELWLRDIDRARTGPAFLLLAAALIVSTSTTAYVGLGAYAAILAVRQMADPTTILFRHALALFVIGLIGVIVILAIPVLHPELWDRLGRVATVTVTDKLASNSGQTRLFWALQGLDAFSASWGLGIGAGSFRSSSLLTAIIGSTGVIGTLAFLIYQLRVLVPPGGGPRRADDLRGKVGAALAWTTIVMLCPAFVAAPSPDPGFVWAVFCGLAIALRRPAPAALPRIAQRPVAAASAAAAEDAAIGGGAPPGEAWA